MVKHRFYRYVVKRIFDILLSFLFIILCSVLLWWWVFIINYFVTKGKPVFAQKRIGYKEKTFTILKFRTMRASADQIAPNMLDTEFYDANVTKFGKFLRNTSIDETLQFFNVFFGKMSLIGPRPAMVHGEEELHQLRKQCGVNPYLAKPGISGFSQTHLLRAHDPASKAFHDGWYVEHLSFCLDFKIFFLTLLILFGFNPGR